VSSNQSIGYPNIVLNLAVTESIDYIATELEKAVKGGKTLNVAVAELLPKVIKENKQIIFNGNGYSKEWEKEAGKRKLLNLKNTVDALPQLVTKDAIKLFETYKILNERELHARYEIMVETYNKTVNVEGQLMVLMANRYILPAALEYQKSVAQSVAAVKSAAASQRPATRRWTRCSSWSTSSSAAPTGSRRRSTTRATPRRSTRSISVTSSSRRWRSCAKPATSSK
jgi:glutamine synthetase